MTEPNVHVLRYASGGELHRDFHASILDGANYVRDNYGEGVLREILFETGTKVYKTLHEKLKAGDPSELLAWWRYYMDREGADYMLEETDDGAVLTVKECPAIKHLENRKILGGTGLCSLTRILNEAFTSGSPYEIVMEETGDGSCRQTLRRIADNFHTRGGLRTSRPT
ncbi:MAG: hypothetical protein IJC66_10870, partial [Kiritimatiellae bacterium]|nr:hypothetical protein [Kiritimatiellia bacterium]